MIYYFTVIFAVLFYLPVEPLNWHSRVYWWAQDQPLYLWDNQLKLVGPELYYWAMLVLYLGAVLVPAIIFIGIPILVQLISSLLPFQWLFGLAQNCSRLSLDSWRWLRTPFEIGQESQCWVWRIVTVTAWVGLLWALVFGWTTSQFTGRQLAAPPNTVPLCLAFLVTNWLARLEVNLFWKLNESLRQTADRAA